MSARVYLRPEVQRFAEAMERKLLENDGKGGWHRADPDWLLKRLREETRELKHAMARWDEDDPKSLQRIVDEAADVANFAMMIADVLGPESAP